MKFWSQFFCPCIPQLGLYVRLPLLVTPISGFTRLAGMQYVFLIPFIMCSVTCSPHCLFQGHYTRAKGRSRSRTPMNPKKRRTDSMGRSVSSMRPSRDESGVRDNTVRFINVFLGQICMPNARLEVVGYMQLFKNVTWSREMSRMS